MKQTIEKIGYGLVVIYTAGAILSSLYFWATDERNATQQALSAYLGPAKAIIWPYYIFFDN